MPKTKARLERLVTDWQKSSGQGIRQSIWSWLDALADDREGDPPNATVDEMRAAFAAFTTPRRTAARPGGKSEPPELTY